MRLFPILATAALLSAGASSASAQATARDTMPVTAKADSARTGREYRGAYSSGYEISWFQPCDATPGDMNWWVTLTEDARLQRDSLLKLFAVKPTKGLAVVWVGTVSPKMPMGAGHMGRGSRYMLVTRILSLRALDENGQGACGNTGTKST